MKSFDWLFVSVPRIIIGFLILVMVAINLANVVGRHAFGQAIFWSEEIMTLCLVWSVFIGAIAVTYKGEHLKMDLFSQTFPSKWRLVVNVLITLSLISALSYTLYYSYQVVKIIYITGQVSNAAKYPMVIQHVALFVSLIFIILAVILRWKSYCSGDFYK